jgi:hypothetical protein
VQEQLAGVTPLVVVGFSPGPALAALADHLGLTAAVLTDPERRLYRRLGLRRAPVWRVYSPGTVARYAGWALRGRRLHRAVEDTRQLGGDALVVDGRVIRLWLPSTPDDRVSPARIAAAARRLAAHHRPEPPDRDGGSP